MAEFEVLVASKGQNQTMRVFLSATMQDYSSGITLTLHSQQNPFFLFSAKITEENLTQVIRNNTSAELYLSSTKYIIFEQILPAIGPPLTANGDIASFDGKTLEFASKRGVMKIPYLSILFHPAAEKELAEHVYRLNQAEISQLKEQVQKKDEAFYSAQQYARDLASEIKGLQAKVADLTKLSTYQQMELQGAKSQESYQVNRLKLEIQDLNIRINQLTSETQAKAAEISALRGEKDAYMKNQAKCELGTVATLKNNVSDLEKQIQALNSDKMNLENQVYGLKNRLLKYEQVSDQMQWPQPAFAPTVQPRQSNLPTTYQPQENVFMTANMQFYTPNSVRQSSGALSLQTQSILQKYGKNPMIQSILQGYNIYAANPFARQQPLTPASNYQDMHVSSLSTSSTAASVLEKYSSRLRPQPYRAYISPPKQPAAQNKQSNLSNSTLALMYKYLKK